MKLSLALCARNAGKTIGACLASVRDVVDEVVLVDDESTDDTVLRARAARPDITVITHKDPNRHPTKGWTSDFSVLRNKSFDACAGDAILWLDADDVLVHGDVLRKIIETDFLPNKDLGCINARYNYARDKQGRVTVQQTRYRVIRRGDYLWEYPVHEDLKPRRPNTILDICNAPTWVDHAVRPSDVPSAERNLWIMLEWEKRGGAMNDRMWQNTASSYSICGRHQEALPYYLKAAEAGGSNPETDYLTYLRWANALQQLGRFHEAQERYCKALALFPDRCLPFFALGELSNAMGQPGKAVVWAELGGMVGGDVTGPVYNPQTSQAAPHQIKAGSYMMLGEVPRACAEYEALAKIYPEDDNIKRALAGTREIIQNHQMYEGLVNAAKLLKTPAERRALFAAAPAMLNTFPEVARALVPEPDGRPSIAIYCGRAGKPWGPSSVDEGIGGSEEAVVFLSREMAARGWQVIVYAFPPPKETGLDAHGVWWTQYSAWDEERPLDVYVGWRQWRGTDPRGKLAKERWLWCHDMIHPEFFSEDMVASWDRILCLTEWHASRLPEHAKAKLVLTKNGLNPDYLVDGPNKATNFIYASSPDRGLEQLLAVWPKVRDELPKATLDIYYGFTANWLNDEQNVPGLRETRLNVERLVKTTPGVFWHGMVGQMELAHAFARAGFWAYPTSWPETSCITSMKAQAMGCIPVTSRYRDSGVPETTKYDLGPASREGMIRDNPEWMSEWVSALVSAARRTDLDAMRAEMKAWARATFDWGKIADQWTGLWTARSSAASSSRPASEPLALPA